MEDHDLLIVVDATYSMNSYLQALRVSLPQIISISSLTDCFSRIGLLAYRDYDSNGELLEWSGWLSSTADGRNQPDLVSMAKDLRPFGNGDTDEAVKTGLAKAYEVMRPDATTVILIFADAPPHTSAIDDKWTGIFSPENNHSRETKALSQPNSYDGYGGHFVDWASACRILGGEEKRAIVFSVLDPSLYTETRGYYAYLSAVTGGACFCLYSKDGENISKVTVEVLLAWMGVRKPGVPGASSDTGLPAFISRYIDTDGIANIKDEDDPTAQCFFTTTERTFGKRTVKNVKDNISWDRVTAEVLRKNLPKKSTPVRDFAASWKNDPAYRQKAIRSLKQIIEDDVRAIALNPVFGSLWRAVCADIKTMDGTTLLSTFSRQVDLIGDPADKALMKEWLEESYNFTAAVENIIDNVPETDRFPCVCLDPTLNFVRPERADADEDYEGNRPITDFTRLELQEIGRSCDYKILRRLGRILTQLSYFESAADTPAHLVGADKDIIKIPVAVASSEHKNQFWRILLHLILPGTMLSYRAGALLAALSLRLGVEPLTQAAESEMLRFRDKWNDVEVPENWSVGCLCLPLDADKAYRRRHAAEGEEVQGLLNDTDRALFERLIAFKMLQLNLDSTLHAEVGWTPEKTTTSLGPVVRCQSCQCPRSVTIMGPGGKCGLCAAETYSSPEEREQRRASNVSKADNELTPATWVECNVQTCRAQYVVYNPHHLKVRPKCHYCRFSDGNPAPYVECTRCLNRTLWPEEYRPESLSLASYTCPPCQAGVKTIIQTETTAREISAENTFSWLLLDADTSNQGQTQTQDLFSNRSIYHTISTIPPATFLSRIHLFPPLPNPPTLTHSGKLIQNTSSLISTLQLLLARRTIQKTECSLCITPFHKSSLLPACSRHACLQRICQPCLRGWYGLNAPGRVVNVAALSCPFCRRKPNPRTLTKYGMGIHAVAGLATAAEQSGEWIYAWCRDCGFAKRYMERVCARGPTPDLDGWVCDDCRAVKDGMMGADGVVKHCPGCGVLTQKTGGCDHIACTTCGTHWCYFCGERSSEKEIYRHMSVAHGGFFGGGTGEGDWGSDTEYESDE